MNMNVFVARQPIFDHNKNIYAYELLFRSGETNTFPDIDGETATSSLLSSSFLTVGVEKISAGKLAFVNFPQKLLEQGVAGFFPPGKLTVEILEHVNATESIIKECRRLKEQGFQIALDDFVYQEELEELLPFADIIKFDFRITPPEKMPAILDRVSQYNCRLLAEKVETYEEFEAAKRLGFSYFQGYFFSKPEILKNRDLIGSQLSTLRLLNTINSNDELDIDELEEIISHDISITYKLIKYINSSRFGRLEPISSIRQAIAFLGEREIRFFVNLIATSNLAEKKPEELTTVAMIRARFLQKLGEAAGSSSKELFLLGLFSLIDAMLDRKIETLVKQLALSQQLSAALSSRQGELGIYLRLVECYESGNWVQFRYAQKRLKLENEVIGKAYLDSVEWVNDFITNA